MAANIFKTGAEVSTTHSDGNNLRYSYKELIVVGPGGDAADHAHHDHPAPRRPQPRGCQPGGVRSDGRIVVSETEVPILIVSKHNIMRSVWTVVQSDNATEPYVGLHRRHPLLHQRDRAGLSPTALHFKISRSKPSK